MRKFIAFIKEEKQLVFFNTVILVITFGFRLFNWSIGRDTDLYVKYGYHKYQPWGETGKAGLVALKKVFDVFDFNIYFANIVSLLLMLAGTMIWCYFLYYFSNKNNKVAMMLFSGFYLTSGVIVEHYSFTLQNIEIFLALMFVPVVVMLFYYGLNRKRINAIVASVAITTILTLVYQAILLMICATMIIAFVLINNNEETKNITIKKQILSIIATIGFSTLLYFIISKLLILLYFKNSSSYLTDKVRTYKSLGSFIKQMLLYTYMLIFGNSKIISKYIDPILINKAHGGESTISSLHTFFSGTASILFLIIPVLFYIILIKKNRKKISVIMFSLVLILCMLFFFIIGSGEGGIRVHMALPISLSFMVWYIVCNLNFKLVRRIIVMGLLCVLLVQINRTVNCFTTDYEVYNQDKEICNNINDEINRLKLKKHKILVIGKHKERLSNSMRKTFIMGNSVFNWGEMGNGGTTIRSTAFMYGLGIKYEPLTDSKLISKLKRLSKKMPTYPTDGYIKLCKNTVVVKLSN